MSLIASKALVCAASCLFFAFILWQSDKAIFFHVCAFRSMRTKKDFVKSLNYFNPFLVSTKIIPAFVALIGIGMIAIIDQSMLGLLIAIIGVVFFCMSSALHAYAALNRSKQR